MTGTSTPPPALATPAAIVWDWDNTLVDGWAAIAAGLNAAFAAFNATLAIWAIVAYIGIGNTIVDIWLGMTKPLYVSTSRKRKTATVEPVTESLDWRSVLYHGHAGGEVPHLAGVGAVVEQAAEASDAQQPAAEAQPVDPSVAGEKQAA